MPGSVPGAAGRAGTRSTRRVGVWSPGLRGPGSIRGETRASQVPGPSSSCVPWSNTPPGAARPLPIRGAAPEAFGLFDVLGTRNGLFVAASPTAHTLACLRIAGDVAAAGARLATDSSGLTQAGRVSHPLYDKRGFSKSSHPSLTL